MIRLLILLLCVIFTTCPTTQQNVYLTGSQIQFGNNNLCFTYTLSNKTWIVLEPMLQQWQSVGLNPITITGGGATYTLMNNGFYVNSNTFTSILFINISRLTTFQLCITANTQTASGVGTNSLIVTYVI